MAQKDMRKWRNLAVKFETQANLSEGALYLLEIARTNDEHGALEKNVALHKVLEFGQDLIQRSKSTGVQGLNSLLGEQAQPRNFLMIAAQALAKVRNRMHEYLDAAPLLASPVRDFDRHALQAFALALADLGWPRRNANDFDGPSPEGFVSRLQQYDVEDLWMLTLQHYLANIFQDNFAALSIRQTVPELDPATETDLRSVDALFLAQRALVVYRTMRSDQNDAAIMAAALSIAITETLRNQTG